jgi:hypothetical protein
MTREGFRRRLIGTASTVFVLALTLAISGFVPARAEPDQQASGHHRDDDSDTAESD